MVLGFRDLVAAVQSAGLRNPAYATTLLCIAFHILLVVNDINVSNEFTRLMEREKNREGEGARPMLQ